MSKFVTTLLSLCLIIGFSSCATVKKGVEVIKKEVSDLTPYKLGRDITVAYVHAQKVMAPEDKDAIVKVYTVFNDVMVDLKDEQATKVKELIGKEITEKVENTALKAKALVVLDKYWDKLSVYFKIKELQGSSAVTTLREFHDGIQSALVDYNSLL